MLRVLSNELPRASLVLFILPWSPVVVDRC
jgi:hypothetical protein